VGQNGRHYSYSDPSLNPKGALGVNLPPALIAVGVLLAGFILGGILMGAGRVLLGSVAACSAIPVALVAWITAGDKY
jgi:hypothetical protein